MDTGSTIGILVGGCVFVGLIAFGLSYIGFININISLLMYVIYAALFGLGFTIFFVNNGQAATGIVYLLMALAVFVFFGLRWFGQESVFNPPSTYTWPPYVNTCPDYLYYYLRRGNQDTCVDPIGVSRGGSLKLQKLAPGNIKSQEDNDALFFPLATKSSSPDAVQHELCDRARQYGLTWEGVTDGASCIQRVTGTYDMSAKAAAGSCS